MRCAHILHTTRRILEHQFEVKTNMDGDLLSAEENPADRLLRRGDLLRKLRELEEQDEAERAIQASIDEDSLREDFTRLSTGDTVLRYESFLDNQRYYDDLKHVDHRFVDYGKFDTQSPLLVEQDKRMGKGGLCWDAAFILGEYVIDRFKEEKPDKPINAIELGSGTGLAGLIVAKALPGAVVVLTDLPELMPLLTRNIELNFGSRDELRDHVNPVLGEYLAKDHSNGEVRGSATASVLRWGDKEQEMSFGTFDVVLGADVVATLYDPIALSETIAQLSHSRTVVYVSFKERLSSVHRQFESAMKAIFAVVDFVHPKNGRNHNPDVRILVAKEKK